MYRCPTPPERVGDFVKTSDVAAGRCGRMRREGLRGSGAAQSAARVGILASGRAKWLDDPVADADATADLMGTDQQLLIAIARTALQDEADAKPPRPVA